MNKKRQPDESDIVRNAANNMGNEVCCSAIRIPIWIINGYRDATTARVSKQRLAERNKLFRRQARRSMSVFGKVWLHLAD
ncbi:hypothetical protein [Pantoea sp. AS142]|uniref:hypothetical protein n=1 Tax=Pantoea sp. AS142 TaxID=3081292 RepID=UPI00301A9328